VTITEKEWKAFKKIKAKALDRYCQSVLDETVQLCSQSDKTTHERYLEVFELIQERDRAMRQPFDAHSRSKAMLQLKMMRRMELVKDEDLQVFEDQSLW